MKQRRPANEHGFTLVEMMVVLLVMSIVLGATMWGVTGWIQHFTYIKNEDMARFVYLGAQSGLSDYESRGTLDALFDEIRSDTANATMVAEAQKTQYGLPIEDDLHDQQHEYAYLKVSSGGIDQNPLLYKLIGPYLTDAGSMDGSVVLELDMTAKKVYSAFYSDWATGYEYGNHASVVRGSYAIYKDGAKDTRSPSERSEYCVGYFGADQVNVARLETSDEEIEVKEAMLYNEETLHLDFHSETANLENYTDYIIDFYKKTDAGDQKVFSVKFEPGKTDMLGLFESGVEKAPVPKSLSVMDGSGTLLPDKYTFYVGYKKTQNPAADPDDMDLTILLDQQTDSLSLAQLSDEDQAGKTDKKGLSICRFMPDDPALMYAVVNVAASSRAGAALSGSGSKKSNTENDLFATDYLNPAPADGEETVSSGNYHIANNRHLYNLRFAEKAHGRDHADQAYSYTLTRDLYFTNAQIYKIRSGGYSRILPADASFVTIPELSAKSILDGDGFGLYDVKLTNASCVEYPRDAQGRLLSGSAENTAGQIGIFATSKGMIRRLSLRNASAVYLSKEKAGSLATDDSFPVCSDSLSACGILCGRDEGSMQEIYVDDKCLLDATIYQMATPDKKKGCGIGMLAGTLSMKKKQAGKDLQSHDRLYTAGTLTATLGGTEQGSSKPKFAKVTAKAEESGRGDIFDQTGADAYAYGIGGMFGFVWDDVSEATALTDQPSIGLSGSETKEKEQKSEAEGYLAKMPLRKADPSYEHAETPQIETEDVFANWEWSLENHTNINQTKNDPDTCFTGGIAGNLIASVPVGIMQVTDTEGDHFIGDQLKAQVTGGRNYGTVCGGDYVGGILGVNGPGGYLDDCISYGDLKAYRGVSAGIASENYGFIKNCVIDRTDADSDRPLGYFPKIDGNETVAGGITSVNHEDGVILDCSVAATAGEQISLGNGHTMGDDKTILIVGNEMNSIGYLAGINYGVINGGIVGPYLEYSSDRENMTIGGVAGINHSCGVVKHLESSIDFSAGQARYVGGILGENSGIVKQCIFSGIIRQPGLSSSVGMCYGGITAINRTDKKMQNPRTPLVKGCYVVGGRIYANGVGYFTAESDQAQIIARSSAVGGICGSNEEGANITDCYLTAHYKWDANGNEEKDQTGHTVMERQSIVEVKNGLIGGVSGLNRGRILHCGYTDKNLMLQEDMDAARDYIMIGMSPAAKPVAGRRLLSALCQEQMNDPAADMAFYDNIAHYLEAAAGGSFPTDSDDGFVATDGFRQDRASRIAAIDAAMEATGQIGEADASIKQRERTAFAAQTLREMLQKPYSADLVANVRERIGDLKDSNLTIGTEAVNALPKNPTPADASIHLDAFTQSYDASDNTVIITSSNGTGHVGGITGYNGSGADLLYCCSGKWLVETYLPRQQYTATGGIAGENVSDHAFSFNMNLAYVRRELSPSTDSFSVSDQESYFHKYHYVGGVIGTQLNETGTDWIVSGCLNAGKVVNMFGNNAGGIICQWVKNGGTVAECYNFGTLVTGYSDNHFWGYGKRRSDGGGWNGTAGGIVSHMVELNPDAPCNIISCNNYGVINLPMRGVSHITRTATSKNALFMANEAGGIVGEISAENVEEIYVINVKDCLNSADSVIYCHGTVAGIISRIGGFSSRGGSGQLKANSLVVNLDGNRNYSSFFYRNGGLYESVANGNINRDSDYSSGVLAGIDRDEGIGYLSARNNLSVRFRGNNSAQEGRYKVLRDIPKQSYTALCGYNFYIDEKSFHYMKANDKLFPRIKGLDGSRKKIDTTVSAASSDATESAQIKRVSFNNNTATGDALDYLAQEPDRYANAHRLYGLTAADGESRTDRHILTWQQGGYQITQLNGKNGYLSYVGDKKVIRQHLYETDENDATDEVFGPVVYEFDENPAESGRTYTKPLSIYHNYREALRLGTDGISGSRMPFTDEFDMDWYLLDRKYIRMIDSIKQNDLADKVINLDAKEDAANGYYRATWEVVAEDGSNITSAENFDVRIEYFALDEEFSLANYDQDTSTYNGISPKKVENKTAAAALTTFTTPDGLMDDPAKIYYAVVRAKDTRSTLYSQVTEGTYTSYVKLKNKLPTPKFEIVEYGGDWVLHLTNVQDFAPYIGRADLKVGAYVSNKNKNTGASLSGDKMTLDEDSSLLTNYVICTSQLGLGQKDMVLRVYADATDVLSASASVMTVYVPAKPQPQMDFTYGDDAETQEHLNDTPGKPSYRTTLHYNAFDMDDTSLIPPVAQIFRAELYGVVDDGTVSYHETVARKEYALEAGQSLPVTLGYYDVPSGVDLSKYKEFGVEIWYASAGHGDVYQYTKTTAARADKKRRTTGFITDLSEGPADPLYFHRTIDMPVPDMEIVAYGDEWMLHVKNMEDYQDFLDMDGFILCAYKNTAGNQQMTFTAADLADDEDKVLQHAIPLLASYQNNTTIGNITFCAKANGVRTRTVTKDIYVPKITCPNGMAYGWKNDTVTDRLDDLADPYYKGTVEFIEYGQDGGNPRRDLSPANSCKQVFVAELIGQKTVSEGGQDQIVEHTLARKEIELAEGESGDVEFTAADLANLTDEERAAYTKLSVDLWYGATGTGPVYTYFKTGKKLADAHPTRKEGFITDLSLGTDKPDYYFRQVRLPMPQFEIVRWKRDGNWVAYLTNPEAFEGTDATVTIELKDGNAHPRSQHLIDLSAQPDASQPVAVYAIDLAADGSRPKMTAYAAAEGYCRSEEYLHVDQGQLRLKTSISGWETYMNLSALKNETMTYTEEGGREKITYHGVLSTSAHSANDAQYITTELTAKDADGKEVTLYLQTDRYLDKGTGNWTLKDYDIDLSVTSDDATGLDLKDYHDFKVTCWWSAMVCHNNNVAKPDKKVRSWLPVSKEVAEKAGFARENGILTFVGGSYEEDGEIKTGGSVAEPIYFYAASLADATAFYGVKKASYANNDTENPLRIDSTVTITKIEDLTETDPANGTVEWTSGASADHAYRIQLTYYEKDKTDPTVSGNSVPTVSGNETPQPAGSEREVVTKTEVVTGNSYTIPPAADVYDGADPAAYDYEVEITVIDAAIPEDASDELKAAYSKSLRVRLPET
ncbi:MAG: type II secretion system GspH family protein [Lachnospiraceae bacterium]|nr:type II secretion system GspH family protein [Lachnospiraceae bacterium]